MAPNVGIFFHRNAACMIGTCNDLAHWNVELLATDLADGFDFNLKLLTFLDCFFLVDLVLLSFLELLLRNVVLCEQEFAPFSQFSFVQ